MPKVSERVLPVPRYTTLGLGGPVSRFIEDSRRRAGRRRRSARPTLKDAPGAHPRAGQQPGRGADEGFGGTVIHLASQGIAAERDGGGVLC